LSRKIVSDFGSFEDAKIILDDDNFLVMRAVIASEIVHAYPEGMAYKPADELEKAAWTANGRWVKVLSHPANRYINSRGDINGQMENARFRRDLLDPKTRRPCRRGIEVDVRWFKDRTPKDVLEQARNLMLRESSIGFSCVNDPTPGEFQGQHYDFVQRDICIDHLAAPIARGRCPSPYCGIAVDSAEVDVWEETENSIRSGHGNVDRFDPDGFRTIEITAGIKAVVGCPKGKYENGRCTVGMETQSFVFDKSKFTLAQAKAWFNKHQDSAAEDLVAFYGCPVCRRIDEVGLLTVGQRLYKQYGADVLEVIEGHPIGDGSAEDKAAVEKQGRDVSDSEANVDSIDGVIASNRQAIQGLEGIIKHFP
jgi:hypothetical protein